MLEKLKSALALISGWALAFALAAFWFFSRSRRSVPGYSKVEAKSVPESNEDVLKEARKEGLIR
jgi:hypothetical protein